MALGQLYYTSCEHGLSGFAGYQFNAATPGIAPEVMRDVEALTAYEPPRSMPYEPTPEDIAAAPVNLCHRPAEDTGGTSIVANVVFVGADFSRRYGNYFVHALVSWPADEGVPLLPIELWRAPLWASAPVHDTELPALVVSTKDASLNRAQTDAAVSQHAQRHLLASMVTATERAITVGERSVVIIERDTDAIARWIAQVSYLLPPPLARRMSFATYEHRPSYSRLHVLGSVADADVDLSDAAFADFHLYDMLSGRASDIAVHPVAERLVELGPAGAEALWRRLPQLADGDEDTFDRWHPLLAAAALLNGSEVGRADVEMVVGWLSAARARRLGPELVTEVSHAVLAQRSAATVDPRGLLIAAREAGATTVEAEVERVIINADLAAILRAGASVKAMSSPPLSAPALRHAAAAAADAIRSVDARTGAAILVWAFDSDVRLAPDVLLDCGVRSIGPLLARGPIANDLARILVASDDLRRGLVAFLDAGPDRGQVLHVLENGAAEMLSDQEQFASPRLRELLLIVSDRRAGSGPDETLRRVLELRASLGCDDPRADAELIAATWRGAPWTVREALAVLDGVPPVQLDHRTVGNALETPLTAGLAAGAAPDAVEDYQRLCATVAGHPVRRVMSEQARQTLSDVAWIQDVVAEERRDPRGTVPAAGALVAELGRTSPAVQAFGEPHLLQLLDRVPADRLASLLARATPSIRSAYLGIVARRLSAPAPDIPFAARIFAAIENRRTTRASGLTDDFLAGALSNWRRRDVDGIAREWENRDPLLHARFVEWRQHNLGGVSRRLGLKLPWVRASSRD